MSGQRFSKERVRATLQRRLDGAAASYEHLAGKKIDPSNGCAQTRGVGEPAAPEFGRWSMARDLLTALEEGYL